MLPSYIINGTGKIKMGNEEVRFRDGDIIYIPENTTHSIINDGEEMIDFLAFGGFTGKEKKKINNIHIINFIINYIIF
ncbi:MAG TPA: cupin domain-containing protein [Nitrososphaeraceae archaeon]|nr:cupin domain-containing protein [Nitrososphaeraceae archaeon]